jgi:feruloyl esterase
MCRRLRSIDSDSPPPIDALDECLGVRNEIIPTPERVVATEVHDGAITRSRPVFPYPLTARYDGTGDPNSADSFPAVAPPRTPTQE